MLGMFQSYQEYVNIDLADYRIKIGDQHRLFHVNMLRKYVDQEPTLCSVAAILDPVEFPELEIEEEPE